MNLDVFKILVTPILFVKQQLGTLIKKEIRYITINGQEGVRYVSIRFRSHILDRVRTIKFKANLYRRY